MVLVILNLRDWGTDAPSTVPLPVLAQYEPFAGITDDNPVTKMADPVNLVRIKGG